MNSAELNKLAIRKQNAGEHAFGEGVIFAVENLEQEAPQKASTPKGSKVDKNALKYTKLRTHYDSVLDAIVEFQNDENIDKEIFLADVLDLIEEYRKEK